MRAAGALLLAGSCLAPAALARPAAGPPPRPCEARETPDAIELTLRGTPVELGPRWEVTPRLVVICRRATRELEAKIDTETVVDQDFTVRFDDGQPVVYPVSGGHDRELTVPAAAARDFVTRALEGRRMRLRYTFGKYRETSFDLAPLRVLAGPLVSACGLDPREPGPAPSPAGKPAAAAGAPRESVVGEWKVREGVSTLDDLPTVLLSASAKGAPVGLFDLVLRCAEGKLDAYLASTQLFHESERGQSSLAVALDEQPAEKVAAGLSADRSAVFLPEAWPFVRSLVGHRVVAFTYVRYMGPRPPRSESCRVTLRGLEEALPRLERACPAR